MRVKRLIAALLFFLASSCGGEDDTGIPQPVPIPKVSMMRASESVAVDELRVVGLPGTVASEGAVYLDGGYGEVQAPSTSKGSFVATVPYDGNGGVTVRFETSEPVVYWLTYGMVMPPPAPTQLMETTPITEPVDGLTTITGESPEAEKVIIAVNLDSGEVALGESDANRYFQLQLPAQTGDQVEVYVDNVPLGEPWQLTVP